MTRPDSKLFSTILVGISPDERSDHATLRGAALARESGSDLHLVHAVELPTPLWPGASAGQLTSWQAAALERAKTAVLGRLRPLLADAGLDRSADQLLTVAHGHPGKVLLDQARALGADLLLLGPHAKQALLDFGSTARGILSRSEAPVWTQAQVPAPLKAILVAVDFSEHSRRALEFAHRLAAHSGASLRVAHGYAPPAFGYAGPGESAMPNYVIDDEIDSVKRQLEQLMDEFDWGRVQAESAFVEGEVTQSILEAATGTDLIVLGTQGRTDS